MTFRPFRIKNTSEPKTVYKVPEEDKEAIGIITDITNDKIHMSTYGTALTVGKPAKILLQNGNILTTTPVAKWTQYEHDRITIYTETMTYYIHFSRLTPN